MLYLLLALVQNTGSAFHILDEVDIFSRRSAITELIDYARRNADKQFIFITPQDLSDVIPANDIRIIKMKHQRDGKATHVETRA